MRILGTIKHICDPRVWNNSVSFYPMIFSGEGGEFYGEMCISKEYMEKRGIRVGAIGHMDIEFKVGEYKRSDGNSYPVQRISLKNFTLANAGVFTDNVPAATEAPQAAPQGSLANTNEAPQATTEKSSAVEQAAPQAIPANTDNAPAPAGDEPF